MLTPTTVRLSDEHRDQLATLMAHYGARTDARMIRHLITMEYRRITGQTPVMYSPVSANRTGSGADQLFPRSRDQAWSSTEPVSARLRAGFAGRLSLS